MVAFLFPAAPNSAQRLKKCSNIAVLVDECYFEFMDPQTSVAKLGGIWSGGLGDGLVGTGRVPHFMQGMPTKTRLDL